MDWNAVFVTDFGNVPARPELVSRYKDAPKRLDGKLDQRYREGRKLARDLLFAETHAREFALKEFLAGRGPPFGEPPH